MRPFDANIRSSSYYIAQTDAGCPHCGRRGRVLALALPTGHEMRIDGRWQRVAANALVFHIAELPCGLGRRLSALVPEFRPTRAKDSRDWYWANHCRHCGGVLSDDELHCEPGGFMPMCEADAAAIRLIRVDEGCELNAAGYALEPQFFAQMRGS
ncbi:MAG TPA: hypothetical protein VHW71_10585 [Steroidobacteraceae bacterium]|jgi:hypothetical protein|nr:hypothetical protein [Steroidobacteraceae bacterium]